MKCIFRTREDFGPAERDPGFEVERRKSDAGFKVWIYRKNLGGKVQTFFMTAILQDRRR